jgi:hypothetical protein
MAGIEKAVNFPWAICIERAEAAALASLRLLGGIEVAEQGGLIWLRGQRGDERLAARLASLPARDRCEWIAPNQLRKLQERIPTGRLPDLQWNQLDTWLQVEVPTAAFPGRAPAPVLLRLLRSTQEREAELLLTTLEDLKQFIITAAQVRLERLQFAANAEGHVVVRGKPLPPLPGRRFVLDGGVGVPAGFSWEPAVSVDVLAICFGASGDATVLWNEDGTCTRLHSEQFVPLSRSAVRATEEAHVR